MLGFKRKRTNLHKKYDYPDTQGRLVGDLRAVSVTDVLPSLRES